jgi:outer membrane protein OmpA-like peptidoglycan-associated protein
MLPINKIIKKLVTGLLVMVCTYSAVQAQITQPSWWFGVSGAANANWYDGTTQTLNNSLLVPTAFHKGFGIRPYGSVLVEYRPKPVWGIMLNVAYDGRGAKYKNVEAPCNCLATLDADINYISVEPSLRLGFNSFNLYFFAGPRVAFNINNDFKYTQVNQPNTVSNFSSTKQVQVSGQVGLGYDIMVSSANSATKVSLSPFASYHPYFGQEPRSIESLSIQTVRVGMALKIGKGHRTPEKMIQPIPLGKAPEHQFIFTARGPKAPSTLQVSETLPLLNAVFFDDGSEEIPNRYVLLTADQAVAFRENQLQQQQTGDISVRSAGQLSVYYNVLNILGDRMRSNPTTSILLNGASVNRPRGGKSFAIAVKAYLVNVFGIDGARIVVSGSFKPRPPSEKIGGTKDLGLLGAENRRVDIESNSPELLMEIGGDMMKPVQLAATPANPRDTMIVLHVDSAKQLLASWYVDAADQNGVVKHFGPFNNDWSSISNSAIVGNGPGGDYKITMLAQTINGTSVSKDTTIHLMSQQPAVIKELRYSIVFNYDKYTTVAKYTRFLVDIVSPLITSGATVSIHGHTDIIGEVAYDQKLSDSRAFDAKQLIENALTKAGVTNVTIQPTGYGSDVNQAPFDNKLPEQRFYNRTVIIDIIPAK